MFKNKIYLCFAIWSMLVVFSLWFLFPNIRTQKDYKRLMISHQSELPKSHMLERRIQQQRFRVGKHILWTKGAYRFQVRLSSANAELMLDQRSGAMSESFKEMRCLMQEELLLENNETKQMIHAIEAEQGVYDYKTAELLADRVKLFRYLAKGHQLPYAISALKLLMHGTAKHLKFSLLKGEVFFQAQDLKATIQE